MSQVPVVYPAAGTTTPVKVVAATDESGIVNVQVVQLGFPDQGQQIIDTLNLILEELQALRIQDAQGMNIPLERTQNLIDQEL
jgi:hypothetical protein